MAAPRGGRKKTTIDTTIQEDRIGVLPAQCPGKGQQTNENSDDGMPTKKEDEGKINRREDDGMPNRLEEGKINRRGGSSPRERQKTELATTIFWPNKLWRRDRNGGCTRSKGVGLRGRAKGGHRKEGTPKDSKWSGREANKTIHSAGLLKGCVRLSRIIYA